DYSARGDERNPKLNYATPAMNGFDEWFSTENAVATWNPYDPENIPGQDGKYEKRSLYWYNDQNVTEELKGCDSGIIMDRAISFIENAAQNNRPFLAVIWFHAPHAPVIAGPKYRQMYADYDQGRQHYFGCITALDEQIGRLRTKLGRLGIANDTMLWFCSDNGPEGKTGDLGRFRGSTGHFRGRKRSLFEGGLRVPALVEWPARIKPGRLSDVPCCTSDYYPTVMEILQFQMPSQPRPIDGISLLPLIDGKMKSRPVPIAFESRKQSCLTDNRYKLISIDDGSGYMLFDLIKDPAETRDIADENPKIVRKMKTTLKRWHKNCKSSLAGEDYKQKE
ncbi:MAG: sulfatase family protein, partial [Planctomycetota bacterium]